MSGHHHHHGHGACHHKHHLDGAGPASRATRNIAVALGANLSFALVELVGGYWTHSTAIQADAIHDFGDSLALGVALLMQLLAVSPPRKGYTYGLRRLSLLSALMTAIALMVGAALVAFAAFRRISDPVTPHLNGMFWLAILGVAVNGFAAWRMGRGESQNEKALAWHMVEDLLGWVAVLVSSIVMRYWSVPWLDPLLAVVIAVLVFSGGMRSLFASLRLFLQATPVSVSEYAMRQAVQDISGVLGLKGFQFWSLDGEHHVCTIKVEVEVDAGRAGEQWSQTRNAIAEALSPFGQVDLTIEPIFISGTQFSKTTP